MKASSESGLWATVISRTGAETVVIKEQVSGHGCQVSDVRCQLLASLLLAVRSQASAPARGKRGGHRDLNHFREHEPVKSQLDRQRQGMSQRKQPAQASRKKHDV